MNLWIERALHALSTGQPNLAKLYLRRGISQTPEGRIWLVWYDFRVTVSDHAQEFEHFARFAEKP